MSGSANWQFAAGEQVHIRGDRWAIESVTQHADCQAIATSGSGSANNGIRRTFLLPFDRVQASPHAPRVRAVRRRTWARHVAHNLLSAHPFGGLRAAAAATFELMAHQLEPALAMLRHARLRILIADEVGLGKTIQAGIVLNELSHADGGFRGLILSPAGLREQWQHELASRFSLDVTVADTAWLFERARELPPEVNPWALPGIYVASLDLVKRPEVLRALEDVRWDLAVIDEVHNAGVATARLAAARAIGARARRVVLLTGTPPDGDPEAFEAIVSIGRNPHEAPITLFRRSRADAGRSLSRKSVLLPVRLAPDERAVHRLLERYTALVWREAVSRQDGHARLAAMVLRKRALSSAASLLRSVSRRLSILGTTPASHERQLALPLDEDGLGDETSDAVLGASGLADVAHERTCLEEIAAAAERAVEYESKLHWLARLLRRVGEPAIVFTEYRDTLAQIAAFLDAAHHPLLLHGELSPRDRSAVQRAFNRSGRLLLATDAASEGLNLHDRCRLVIHFELPWTPLRLEQRTGRVDRFGQTRVVHEVLMVANDTAERLVLAPLLRRARLAAARTGRSASTLDESRVAEAIMEGAWPDEVEYGREPRTIDLDLRQEAEAEAHRVALHRRLLRSAPAQSTKDGDVAVTIAQTGAADRLLILVELSLRDGSGRTLHAELLPLDVTGGPLRGSLSARELSAWVGELLGANTARLVMASQRYASASLDRASMQALNVLGTLVERERAITADVRSTARTLVQTGLFDRREVHRASARKAVAASLAEDSELRLLSLGAGERLRIEARVVAVRGRG